MSQELFDYGRIALAVALTIAAGILAYHSAHRALTALARRRLLPTGVTATLLLILRWVLLILVTLLVLSEIGVAVGTVWATLSTFLVAIAVGFVAVWSILSNLLSSVIIATAEPFRVGDDIEIVEPTGGVGMRGRVREVTLLYTVLDELDDAGPRDNIVHVPNNIFFQKSIRKRVTEPASSGEMPGHLHGP